MRRMLPPLVAAVAGLILMAINVTAVEGEIARHRDDLATTMTIERCVHGTCTGSYRIAGAAYHDRLLLGQASPGERLAVLVNRRHPGDASPTGWGAAVEAGLLAVAGAVIAGVAARRAWRQGRSSEPLGRRGGLQTRSRVWDVGDPTE